MIDRSSLARCISTRPQLATRTARYTIGIIFGEYRGYAWPYFWSKRYCTITFVIFAPDLMNSFSYRPASENRKAVTTRML